MPCPEPSIARSNAAQDSKVCARKSAPIFVIGHPRSGTTFTAHLFALAGIPVTAGFPFFDEWERVWGLFDVIRDTAARNAEPDVDVKRRMERLFTELAFSLSPTEVYARRDSLPRFANRTPRLETYADRLDDLFANKPLYVCCIRDGWKVILSTVNMAWSRRPPLPPERPGEFDEADVRAILGIWKASVRAIEQLQSRCPDRAFVFQVDRYDSPGQRLGYLKELFAFLAADVEEPGLSRTAEEWPVVNYSSGRQYTPLTPPLIQMLEEDGGFREIQRRYGYQSQAPIC